MVEWWTSLSIHTRTVVTCAVLLFIAIVVIPTLAVYADGWERRWAERRAAAKRGER